ncbi:methylated-DNA--[protein]-cysteine S-methyltransferase [PVC group bacterium]|nr:methylated-DNA--[protein]-cysteine S-methyltransferase [PVC group bacterium]
MILQTDIGSITLGYLGRNLFCEFGKHRIDKEPSRKLSKQLEQYFNGIIIHKFVAPIPTSSPFMQKCWAACREIPYGETISYGELAEEVGSPKAARAAGQAMKRNPLSVITPCHRVISSTGKLHGFAGTTDAKSKELKIKEYLISLEQSCT